MHHLSELHWSDIFACSDGLSRFLGAMQVLHKELGRDAAQRSGLADAVPLEQRRLDALRHDLKDSAPVASPPDFHKPQGRNAAWGVLYALNGSALGASMLLQPGAALAGQSSAYLNLMQDYAKSGALGGFFRALNGETLDINRAAAGADMVFSVMARCDVGEAGVSSTQN